MPQQQHHQEAKGDEHVAQDQRGSRTAGLNHLCRQAGNQDHGDGDGQDRRASLLGAVAQHVLKELLADEHRSHPRAEDDDSGHGSHPEGTSGGDVQVVQRAAGPQLAEGERDKAEHRDHGKAENEGGRVWHDREVDAQDQGSHHDHGQDAAEVVDRLGRLAHIGGDQDPRHNEPGSRDRQGDQEDRPPPEAMQQYSRQQGASAAMAAPDARADPPTWS